MLNMNCWLFSSHAARIVGRCYSSIGLGSHPYFDFLPFSPLYIASPFHLIQVHKCLVADVRLAGMLDTNPCFLPPFVLYTQIAASRRSSPGAGVPTEADTNTSRPPLTRT